MQSLIRTLLADPMQFFNKGKISTRLHMCVRAHTHVAIPGKSLILSSDDCCDPIYPLYQRSKSDTQLS